VRHCRLGGELRYVKLGGDANGVAASRDGIFLVGNIATNKQVIKMWKGTGTSRQIAGGLYPAGCTITRS